MDNIDKWLKEQGITSWDLNWPLIKNVVTNALKQDREDRMTDVSASDDPVVTVSNMSGDWIQIELDNDFKCINCNAIVETPYFISTDVPGRHSPLLDGPRCKECHKTTTLERDAEKYKYVEFRTVSRNWVTTIMKTPKWECYSIKYDFFIGDIEYFDGRYVFCAAATDVAFNANALGDITAFLAALADN